MRAHSMLIITILFLGIAAAGCCPQADCKPPLSFDVVDQVTGTEINELVATTESGTIECRPFSGQTLCTGGPVSGNTIVIELSAPGYKDMTVTGLYDDNADFCPGCPTYNLFIEGQSGAIKDVLMEPQS